MNGYNRLVRRNHTYYIRARIPNFLTYLIHKSQFCYSLKTNNYYEALAKLSKESHKVDMKLNLLKSLDMRIKNKQLLLDPEDIDRMVIHKLKQAEEVFENYYDEIELKQYDYKDLLIFNKNVPHNNKSQQELECVELFIKEYFKDLKDDERTHRSVIKQIGRIDKEEIPIIADKNKPSDDIKKVKTALTGVEKYILNKIKSIEENIEFSASINPRVKRCLDEIHQEQNERSRRPTVSTPWDKVFREFSIAKSNERTSKNTIKGNEQCLKMVFDIIGKKYVEQVTYKDCQNVCRLIYNLPARFNTKYKGKKLLEVLNQPNDDTISLTTVKKYLRTFKEFMIFCKSNRYIPDSFESDIKITRRKEAIPIEAFTKDELKAIFNHKTYPLLKDRNYAYRYFIPLIGLYQGMRLNEICQLYIEDVRLIKKVWCFDINDSREDQNVKNKQSKRIIPIHPKLIELGLLDYINKIRETSLKTKEYPGRIFYQFKYSKKNHYIHPFSQWFGRYLKRIGIDSRSKVFHSFRHLVKQYMTINDISKEFQDKLMGWVGDGTGERVYSGTLPIKKLEQELSKLKYPFLETTLTKLHNRNK